MFIKISNNFGILPAVPKYIELNGLINYKYGSKTLQHTHTQLFIKISNNFGILPTVPKYIELNGMINYKYGSKTQQHTHSGKTISMNSKSY